MFFLKSLLLRFGDLLRNHLPVPILSGFVDQEVHLVAVDGGKGGVVVGVQESQRGRPLGTQLLNSSN